MEPRPGEGIRSYVGRVCGAARIALRQGDVARIAAEVEGRFDAPRILAVAERLAAIPEDRIAAVAAAFARAGVTARQGDDRLVAARLDSPYAARALEILAAIDEEQAERVREIRHHLEELGALPRHPDLPETMAAEMRGVSLGEPLQDAVFRRVAAEDVRQEARQRAASDRDPLVRARRDAAAALGALLARESLPFFPDQLLRPDVADPFRDGDVAGAVEALGDAMASRIDGALRLAGVKGAADLVRRLEEAPRDGLALVRGAVPPGVADARRAADLATSALGATPKQAARVRALCLRAGRAERAVAAARAQDDAAEARLERARVRIARDAEREAARQVREAERERRRRERSLIAGPALRRAVGADRTEFRRWLAEGRIPVAATATITRFGRAVEITRHEPSAIAFLVERMSLWRSEHDSAARNRRREIALASPAVAAANEAARRAALLRPSGLDVADWPRGRAPLATGLPGLSGTTLETVFPLPPEILAATAGPLPRGRARAALDRTLRDARDAAAAEAMRRLALVLEGHAIQVAATRQSIPEASRHHFDEMLARHVRTALSEPPLVALPAEELAAGLATRLGRAVAAAVNAWSRDRERRDVRTASGMDDYVGLFPTARAMRRRLLLFVGPTNSGKTHAAMELLRVADRGAYLAPLRLMALEGADRLNALGVPTDMVTGEESVLAEGARHVSSTIEMADLSRRIDVAVIDEIQTVADHDRGWAWTQAVVGIPASVVAMTGSADAIPFVARLADMTGDDLEIRSFERLSPLRAMPGPIGLEGIRAGDAVIAFTRAEVLRLGRALAARGLGVASIYGALGPEVRRAESARFRSGEAGVLVATDAIGMGLNLPIRRVVFSALDKFDGRGRRPLTGSEIRQIAGRAGRYGMHEDGLAGVLDGLDPMAVAVALESSPPPPDDDRVPVMPTWGAVEAVSRRLATDDLRRILDYVRSTLLEGDPRLRASAMETQRAIASYVARSGLSLQDRYRYLGAPVESRSGMAMSELAAWARHHAEGRSVRPPRTGHIAYSGRQDELERCEEAVKRLSTYLWLARRFPVAYDQPEAAAEARAGMNDRIEEALARRAAKRAGDAGAPDARWAALEALRSGRAGTGDAA